jgi:hypothetical protein
MHPRHNAVTPKITGYRFGGKMSALQIRICFAEKVVQLAGVCLAGLAMVPAFDFASADDQIPVRFNPARYSHLWERNPLTLVAPATQQAQPSVFDKLVLVSWLKDAGKDVIFVQNTETNDTQKITPEPNKDNFRIVEIHPNDNPKLVEAVISNGNEKGTVKFRFDVPAAANQAALPAGLATGVPGQAPGAVPQNPQNPQPNLPGVVNPNALQGAQPAQVPQPGVPQPGAAQNPRALRTPELRRKRVLPAPGSAQPVQMPAPGPMQNSQN